MTKIDIISGFLGAGKTTLIAKLIGEAYKGEKLVLIENEFGEIGIDAGFLKESGVEITEMNSGCICCTLVGDFAKALGEVLDTYAPERIIIEPSGVGKLSDVKKAVAAATEGRAALGAAVTVVDAAKAKIYAKNFGEFYNDQVESADCLILSRTDLVGEAKLQKAVEILRGINPNATMVTTPWSELSGAQIREAMAGAHGLAETLNELEHHHHEHHHDEHCECGHHHHEHHHDEHCDCGHHHDEHDAHCSCGHHHADEVFVSFGRETTAKYESAALYQMLEALMDEGKYGQVLRAKGMVAGKDGVWLHFDYVPGEAQVREGAADIIGKICVIGAKLNEQALCTLFGLEG